MSLEDDLKEILPKGQHGKVERIVALLEDIPFSLGVIGGYIPVETLTFPNGTVELDASGNITEIHMDEGLEGIE